MIEPLGPSAAPPRHLTLHPVVGLDADFAWEVRCPISLPAERCPLALASGTAAGACILHLLCAERPTAAQLSMWAAALTYCAPHMQSWLAREVGARQRAQLHEENQYFHRYFHRHYLIKTLAFESAAMHAMREAFNALLQQQTPALISGEAGSGKQLYARALHYMSDRAPHLFVALSCSEQTDLNLDQDLFGEAPSRRGLLEMLDGGTLFLDDIDRLPLPLQGKLVRVLNEGEVRRSGDEAARAVDVRVLASSHHPLLGLVERGLFRRDLFATLSAATLYVPPLRDRPDDILPLAESFRRTFSHRYGLGVDALDSSAQSRLISYTWPGNVRELQVVIETAVLKAQRGAITAAHLNLRSDPC